MTVENSPKNKSQTQIVFRALHSISLKLHSYADIDTLYKILVETAREVLEVDRIGILLFSDDQKNMIGTFGTDTNGMTTDERSFNVPIPEKDKQFESAISYRDFVVFREDVELYHIGGQVGKGWSAMYALWDDNRPYGWLSGDNLLRHRPLGDIQRELFGIYGAFANNLIQRKKYELELEARVEEKTRALEEKMSELVQAREYVRENEKIISLGNLVAGIAHEINTPIGNAIGGASYWQNMVYELKKLIKENKLTKSALEKFLENLNESGEVIQASLNRAAELISNFKKLAVNSSKVDFIESWNICDLVNSVMLSHSFNLKKKQVQTLVQIPPDVSLGTWPGAFSQVLSNLIQNSLFHAFDDTARRKICISAQMKESMLNLWYEDNGCGIQKDILDHLFQPFVTTKRGQGGSGLGMNIVYTTIIKNLQGTIEYFTPENGGTGFLIKLPNLL